MDLKSNKLTKHYQKIYFGSRIYHFVQRRILNSETKNYLDLSSPQITIDITMQQLLPHAFNLVNQQLDKKMHFRRVARQNY